MEVKKAMTVPSSGIQDMGYFYNIIEGLNRKGGRTQIDKRTIGYFRQMINDYNEARASKYGFSFKPRELNDETVRRAVFELLDLGLLSKDGEYLSLTNSGRNVATLITDRNAEGLKRIFGRLLLEKYSIFEYFLRRIREISGAEGFPLPFINAQILDRFGGASKQIANGFIEQIRKRCPNLSIDYSGLYNLLDASRIDALEKRTEKVKKLQSIMEKFLISQTFGSNIASRRAFDIVRSRTTFLELTNYAIFDFDGFSLDTTYMISDFAPVFRQTTERIDYSKGTLYINHPTFEESRELLKTSLTRFYATKKDEFGYVRITEARDVTCRELRISDSLFDSYLKRIYKEEPRWLSFTYLGAGERITDKRLPFVMEEPIREFFTQMRINLGG